MCPALTLFIFWPPIYSVLSLPSLPWAVTGTPVPLLPVSLQRLKQFLEIEQEPSLVDKKIDSIPWPTHSLCSSQTKKNKLKTRKTLDTGSKGNFPGCQWKAITVTAGHTNWDNEYILGSKRDFFSKNEIDSSYSFSEFFFFFQWGMNYLYNQTKSYFMLQKRKTTRMWEENYVQRCSLQHFYNPKKSETTV